MDYVQTVHFGFWESKVVYIAAGGRVRPVFSIIPDSGVDRCCVVFSFLPLFALLAISFYIVGNDRPRWVISPFYLKNDYVAIK